jgi:peptidoglycan/xylan/chitin deacetylase (PgdA/CDA1 family)
MSLRWNLRRVRDRLLQCSGLLALAERRLRDSLTILTFHRVLPEGECARYPFPSLALPEQVFAATVAWLGQRCEVKPLGAALRRLEAGPLGRPLVALTFDDGYADNRERAAPILERAGLRATFFLATDFVESGAPLWFDVAAARLERMGSRACVAERVEALKALSPPERARGLEALFEGVSATERSAGWERFRPMTPAQAAEMARAGHEIASHTASHPLLTSLTDQAVLEELQRARDAIRRWTGLAPEGLAYPNGDFDARIAGLAVRAGHRWACTTRAGRQARGGDPLCLPRLHLAQPSSAPLARFSGLTLRCQLSLLHERMRRSA